jgi:hypothetical protein
MNSVPKHEVTCHCHTYRGVAMADMSRGSQMTCHGSALTRGNANRPGNGRHNHCHGRNGSNEGEGMTDAEA